MTKNMLLKKLERLDKRGDYRFSSSSVKAVKDCLDGFEIGQSPTREVLEEAVLSKCNKFFIYTDESFNYLILTDNRCLDFDGAFKKGYTDVISIANYHLRKECSEIVSDLFKKRGGKAK